VPLGEVSVDIIERLLHSGNVIELLDSAVEAVSKGDELFDDGLFSVQRVAAEVVDLGFFSHAGHPRDS
jgi:hypothetical protein